jgi:hypothetical protein
LRCRSATTLRLYRPSRTAARVRSQSRQGHRECVFPPDAIEALVSLGRHTEAEPLIEALEGNDRRSDRAWILAVGARCLSMSLAARGDVDAAERMARQALVEHDRIPMRFERARTQLLLGQLQRRQRQEGIPQRR